MSLRQIWLRIYSLFGPTFIAYDETRFQEFAAGVEFPRVNYDCDAITEDFSQEDAKLKCCDLALPTTLKVTALYGGRGVEIVRAGTCPVCHKAKEHQMRLRDGYSMYKDQHDKWVTAIPQPPLIWHWIKSLFYRG